MPPIVLVAVAGLVLLFVMMRKPGAGSGTVGAGGSGTGSGATGGLPPGYTTVTDANGKKVVVKQGTTTIDGKPTVIDPNGGWEPNGTYTDPKTLVEYALAPPAAADDLPRPTAPTRPPDPVGVPAPFAPVNEINGAIEDVHDMAEDAVETAAEVADGIKNVFGRLFI